MIKNFLIPAACNPSTICSRIGFPRTLIIGLGRSDVSSRIRVPRPAASKTALSILFMTVIITMSRCGRFVLKAGSLCSPEREPDFARDDDVLHRELISRSESSSIIAVLKFLGKYREAGLLLLRASVGL